jgi:hypothetical protein
MLSMRIPRLDHAVLQSTCSKPCRTVYLKTERRCPVLSKEIILKVFNPKSIAKQFLIVDKDMFFRRDVEPACVRSSGHRKNVRARQSSLAVFHYYFCCNDWRDIIRSAAVESCCLPAKGTTSWVLRKLGLGISAVGLRD